MKKSILILTALTIAFSSNYAIARNVSGNEAKMAAACYMNNLGGGHKVDTSDLTLIHKIMNPKLDVPSCYFFNVADWGWVIMSATTVTDPIVAYGDNGITLNMDEAPSNMIWWLYNYAALIAGKQVEDSENALEEDKLWYELWGGSYSAPKNGTKANVILLHERWGQGGNDGDTYNLLCPRHKDVPTITGCVATALSQIIHYYSFPVQGQGYNYYRWYNPKLNMTAPGKLLKLTFDTMFFDYSLMPDFINSASPIENRREVARLCYAVGVAMSMTYGTIESGGSGAVSADVPNVMANNFKYNRCTHITRDAVGDSAFMDQIRGDLELKRPIYMSGTSNTSVGRDDRHAWVCDGYKTNNLKMYHMNWGWESKGDGYYNLYDNTASGMRIYDNSSLHPRDMGYTFTLEQTAMIGLIPPHPDSSDVDFMPNQIGISNVSTPELLPAFPNPACFSVTLPYSIQHAESMTIYNIEGKVMEQHILQPANDHIDINVTEMPAGIYFYRIGGATGKFLVQ